MPGTARCDSKQEDGQIIIRVVCKGLQHHCNGERMKIFSVKIVLDLPDKDICLCVTLLAIEFHVDVYF